MTTDSTIRARNGRGGVSLLTRVWTHACALAGIGQVAALAGWIAQGKPALGLILLALSVPLLAINALWMRRMWRRENRRTGEDGS